MVWMRVPHHITIFFKVFSFQEMQGELFISLVVTYHFLCHALLHAPSRDTMVLSIGGMMRLFFLVSFVVF